MLGRPCPASPSMLSESNLGGTGGILGQAGIQDSRRDGDSYISNTTLASFADIGYVVTQQRVPLPGALVLMISAMISAMLLLRRSTNVPQDPAD